MSELTSDKANEFREIINHSINSLGDIERAIELSQDQAERADFDYVVAESDADRTLAVLREADARLAEIALWQLKHARDAHPSSQ